jgi:hypothetical protein
MHAFDGGSGYFAPLNTAPRLKPLPVKADHNAHDCTNRGSLQRQSHSSLADTGWSTAQAGLLAPMMQHVRGH